MFNRLRDWFQGRQGQSEEYTQIEGRRVKVMPPITATPEMMKAIREKEARKEAEKQAAWEEEFRKQVIELDENEEAKARRVVEEWTENRVEIDEDALRLASMERDLLSFGPASMEALAEIVEQVPLGALETEFANFHRSPVVDAFMPVEFFEFAGRDGDQVGLIAHDPDCEFRNWKVMMQNYTDGDIRLSNHGDDLVQFIDLHIDYTLDCCGIEESEELVEVLPLLNEALDFRYPSDLEQLHSALGREPSETAPLEPAASPKPQANGIFWQTLDEMGVLVPDGTIDTEFLATLEWPEMNSRGKLRCHTLSNTFLTTAIERLKGGEPGTALAIMRNYQTVLANSDLRNGDWLRSIRIVGKLLTDCYLGLERPTLAGRVIERTHLLCEP